MEDKTVALSCRDFRGLAASSEITTRPKSHQAFHVYLADIAQYFGSKRLTEMADLSGFQMSGFDVLSMTYLNPQFAPPNDDIAALPQVDL